MPANIFTTSLKGPKVVFRAKLIPRAPFDRSIIKTNWRAINKSPLQQAGVFVRRKMRDLIRKDRSKKQLPSKPGKPPKARLFKGDFPFRRIFSVPDNFHTQVVIGHVGWGASQTPMETHEFGKRKKVRLRTRRKTRPMTARAKAAARRKFQAGAIPQQTQFQYQTKTVRYPKREFARPALEKTIKKIPALWRNSVSSSTIKGK